MEQCSFCKRTVVDEAGEKTEDLDWVVRGRHVCARCMKAFEYALGG